MRPFIDSGKCTLCGACARVCPSGVFAEAGGKMEVKNPGACIQCKACEVSCPAKGISFKE